MNGHEKLFDLPKELFGYKRYCEIDISKYIQQGRNTVTFSSPDFEGSALSKGLRLYVELVERNDNEYSW